MAEVAAVQPGSLDARRWVRRVLLVFAPTTADPRFAAQKAAAHGEGFVERHLTLVTVAGDAVTGASDGATALRRRFGISAHEFRVLLIGLDGGAKLTAAAPIPLPKLLSTIDAMPMAQAETRR